MCAQKHAPNLTCRCTSAPNTTPLTSTQGKGQTKKEIEKKNKIEFFSPAHRQPQGTTATHQHANFDRHTPPPALGLLPSRTPTGSPLRFCSPRWRDFAGDADDVWDQSLDQIDEKKMKLVCNDPCSLSFKKPVPPPKLPAPTLGGEGCSFDFRTVYFCSPGFGQGKSHTPGCADSQHRPTHTAQAHRAQAHRAQVCCRPGAVITPACRTSRAVRGRAMSRLWSVLT